MFGSKDVLLQRQLTDALHELNKIIQTKIVFVWSYDQSHEYRYEVHNTNP